jgi:antitoxin (DNA-binding transcriptional repressor) of toxin-antitoxin stability system
MATIHITEAEAAKDLSGLIDRVRDGAEVVIERNEMPVAQIRNMGIDFKSRSMAESLAIAEAYVRELGYDPALDENFAADMEAVLRERKPWMPQPWE